MTKKRMTDLWRRVDNWLLANAPEVCSVLQAGATDAQIRDTEAVLGIVFPDDVRASFRVHNGQSLDAPGAENGLGILDAHEFFSLDRMVEEWQMWKRLLDTGTFAQSQALADPEVETTWWSTKWIPLTHDGCANNVCLDMGPTKLGTVGQIITVWHDSSERQVLYASFTDWLTEFADDLEAGEYILSDEYGGIVRESDL